jgi:hypothetical protein
MLTYVVVVDALALRYRSVDFLEIQYGCLFQDALVSL